MPLYADAPVRHYQGIYEYRLENGLRLLCIPDPNSNNTTINLTFHVGSQQETYGKTGIAHLLEHMIFRGTTQFPNVLSLASERGLQLNASTHGDFTRFYATFSSDPEQLAWFLRWQCDTICHLQIDDASLALERHVVVNEYERHNDHPEQQLLRRLLGNTCHYAPPGWSIIGTPDNLQQLQASDLQAFFQHYYQPDNATVIIAGHFDLQHTLNQVADTLGALPKPGRSLLPPAVTIPPPLDGERHIVLRQPAPHALVVVAYPLPGRFHPQGIQLELAAQLLCDSTQGSLFQHLVNNTEVATQIACGLLEDVSHSLLLFSMVVAEDTDVETAQQALCQAIEHIDTTLFTPQALQRLQRQRQQQWQQIHNDTHRLALQLSHYCSHGDWRSYFWEADCVQQASHDTLSTYFTQYIHAHNRSSATLIPTDNRCLPSPLPLLREPPASALAPYQSPATLPPSLAALDVSPTFIQEHTIQGEHALPAGRLRYALLPKASRGDQVYAYMRFKYSDVASLSPTQTPVPLSVLSGVMAALFTAGTPQYSQTNINDFLAEHHSRLFIHTGGNQLVLGLQSTQSQLPKVIPFALMLLREAHFPEEAIEHLRKQAISGLQAQAQQADHLAAKALHAHLNPYRAPDFRADIAIDDKIAALQRITSAMLCDFARRHIGAGDIDLALVGAFNNNDALLAPWIDTLSTWPKAPPYAYIPDPFYDAPPLRQRLYLPGKENAVLVAGLNLHLQSQDADFPALLVADFLLGGSQQSALFDTIRQQMGLSYDVHSYLNVSAMEPSGEWLFELSFAPQHESALIDAFLQTLQTVRTKGFTHSQVQKAISAILKIRQHSRSDPQQLAQAWLRFLERGSDFHWVDTFEKRLRNVTATQVQQALQRHLRIERISMVLAGDLAPTDDPS